MASIDRAAIMAMVPEWSWTLSLIFAGCCSNAYWLEQATRIQPACGTLMTFLQFCCTTLQMLPTQLHFSDPATGRRYWFPRWKQPQVPLTRWSWQVAMYFGTTLLNNSAFSFHVPVPVHIIFRSGGLVVSMLAGYVLKGRRYSPLQIVSVLMVTVGVIVATVATTPADDGDAGSSSSGGPSAATYFAGIGLLTAALFLSAVMGLYQEQTFGKYGKQHWQEGLFYNHFLSLPLFVLRRETLQNEWQWAQQGPQMWFGWGPPTWKGRSQALQAGLWRSWTTSSPEQLRSTSASTIDVRHSLQEIIVRYLGSSSLTSSLVARMASVPQWGLLMPALMPALAMNCLFQLVCVNGVNRLTAMCSSLTVTLVLVVRKAVSLAISVLIVAPAMGEEVHGQGMLFVGASLVMLGTLGYGLGTKAASTDENKKQEDQPTEQTKKDKEGAHTSALESRTQNGQSTRKR